MSLKDLLPKKSETKKDLFWSVVIESGWIQAGVWEVENEIVKIISVGPPCAWKADEELIGWLSDIHTDLGFIKLCFTPHDKE